MNARLLTQKHLLKTRTLPAIGAALMSLLAFLAWSAPQAGAQTSAAKHTVYLPLLRRAGSGGATPTATQRPTATPTPTATQAPAPSGGGFFFNRQAKNNSADVAVDTKGGLHAAYAYFTPDTEHPPAVYRYCPGPARACASPAAWSSVQLGDLADEVQLALTPSGAPRLLIVTASTVYSGGKDYFYAACDRNCAQRSAWTLTRIVSSWGTSVQDINDQRLPQHSFALDPQGRPRFIYQDRNYFYAEPDHIGAYYVFCDAGCADASNWRETRIGRAVEEQFRRDYEIFDTPSLTFTAAGQPRVVARVFAFNEDGSDAPDGLYYLACDRACETRANWARVFLIPTGSGSYPHPSWDLALATGGRPRIALFTGGGLQPDEVNYRLLYLWCDSGCLDQSRWLYNNVGLGEGSGQSADLELDQAGRPRLAWLDSRGDLGYAWCNTGCESDQPQWQQRVVETEAMLKREFPQALPPHCDSDTWEGLAPALALDAAGQPRVAYDVSVEARCSYDETPGDPTDPPTIRFEAVWRGVHWVFFPQP